MKLKRRSLGVEYSTNFHRREEDHPALAWSNRQLRVANYSLDKRDEVVYGQFVDMLSRQSAGKQA